ncbi:MAG: DUF72 domain-containing protein [Alphaproteobacteria bacterium]|nr:DUF72 domain-containing protein [Alphaproteobacteria bacterium]
MICIGTAGWSIPAQYAEAFAGTGTHLARYATRMNAVEINSSFYRPHQRKTYERWAASVPDGFRFSVKLPRSITQEHRLKDCDALLSRFLEESAGLGAKLGVILVQLPPTLAYDADVAADFFVALRQGTKAAIACEPRHASWFTPKADAALKKWHVARVAADPPRAPADGAPGGWQGLRYWRLHGSPKIYYSDYDAKALKTLAGKQKPGDWCIFDNTAAFAALGNALALASLIGA